jgi:Raf kinase inhibitor-like YbhB/YbcL family protein
MPLATRKLLEGRPVAMKLALVTLAAAGVACSSSSSDTRGSARSTASATTALALTTPAFADGATVPTRFTCAGANVSPPLAWSSVPPGAKELALVMEDPDAPRGTFVHWVVWGIAPGAGQLAEGTVPAAAHLGRNGAGSVAYTGPCPPAGPAHHYGFTLFALSAPISLPAGATADQLRAALAGKVLSQAKLTGLYAR